jgi:undecaprenyl-diphosphatase
MNIFHAILLGLVQGAGEFLPISSSAHLILAPWLFHFPDPGLSFDVALHTGTLLAVLLYFWKDWLQIFRLALKNFQFSIFNFQTISNDSILNYKKNTKYNNKILYFLIVATVPGVLAGYFLESYAESIFRSPLLIALALFLMGLALFLVDRYHTHRKHLDQLTWIDSLWIGLSQAIAIIPGVSRSGATITTGLFLGLSRESAARFSFLLSTPIILGAAALKLPKIFETGIDIYVIAGMLSAAISGYLAIKYLLKFVEKASYVVFFWYRLALAFLIGLVYLAR